MGPSNVANRVTCPFCQKQLRLKHAPVPGRRTLCTGCNRSFVPALAPAVPLLTTDTQPVALRPIQSPLAIGNLVAAPESQPAALLPPAPAAIPLPAPQSAPAPAPAPVLQPVPAPMAILAPRPAAILIPRPAPEPAPFSPEPLSAEPSKGHWRLLGVAAAFALLVTTATVVALAFVGPKPRETASLDQPKETAPANLPSGGNQSGKPQPGTQTKPAQSGDPDTPPPPANGTDISSPRPVIINQPPELRPDAPMATDTARSVLPRELQVKVNEAIDEGVAYLRKQQLANGTFSNQHTTAYAAMPALTLLECGALATDPIVQKAARFVRSHAAKLSNGMETYELSLALLFLDRLGDPKDKQLIRHLGMRLAAGQLPDGGWSYRCPILTFKEERELFGILRLTQPVAQKPEERKLEPLVRKPGEGPQIGPGVTKTDEEKGSKEPGTTGTTIPVPKPDDPIEAKKDRPATPAEVRKALRNITTGVRNLPVVQNAVAPFVDKRPVNFNSGSDNSNTQFAILGLWAALRHGVPVEGALARNAKRIRDHQRANGSWGYHANGNQNDGSSPAMTGSGLLALAVGHGVKAGAPKGKAKVDDPAVHKGLEALAVHVGKPIGADPVGKARLVKGPKGKQRIVRRPPQSPVNLYFMWTVERVGVLYNIRDMDGKDWYRWGVEQLLSVQEKEGSWSQGNYYGSTRNLDTCLALLFLKRANLTADLTRRLEFVIRAADAKPNQ